MNPILQFMAGPLLRYDTVDEDGVWHGAAMIVSECTSAKLILLWFLQGIQLLMQDRYTNHIPS